MEIIDSERIDEATEAFHDALTKHADNQYHDRLGHWVDGESYVIVEALLLDGWHPPARG